jgi:hypothetical protein
LGRTLRASGTFSLAIGCAGCFVLVLSQVHSKPHSISGLFAQKFCVWLISSIFSCFYSFRLAIKFPLQNAGNFGVYFRPGPHRRADMLLHPHHMFRKFRAFCRHALASTGQGRTGVCKSALHCFYNRFQNPDRFIKKFHNKYWNRILGLLLFLYPRERQGGTRLLRGAVIRFHLLSDFSYTYGFPLLEEWLKSCLNMIRGQVRRFRTALRVHSFQKHRPAGQSISGSDIFQYQKRSFCWNPAGIYIAGVW